MRQRFTQLIRPQIPRAKRQFGALVLLPLSFSALADVTLNKDAQSNLSLTLYTDNLGLVQEERSRPKLEKGEKVFLEDVSPQMQTETLNIQNAGSILHQSLNNKTLSLRDLLNQSIGQPIILAKSADDGSETQQTVTLLSYSGQQLLVRHNDRIESVVLSNPWRVIFPNLPSNLSLKPSLEFTSNGVAKPGSANISYLTGGLNWQMDYVITLNKERNQMQLKGLASLSNTTGTSFDNANIKLLAGNVNQLRSQGQYKLMSQARALQDGIVAEAAPSMASSQGIADYQIYELPNPITLADQQYTQVPLISDDDAKVDSMVRYAFSVSGNAERSDVQIKPESLVRFYNNPHFGLGQPLPAGNARVFVPDNSGQLQYVGAAPMPQAVQGDRVDLSLGQAFEQTIEKKQVDFQETYDGTIVAYEFTLRNRSEQARQFELQANLYTPWSIVSSSEKPAETTSSDATWHIDVGGKSETQFTVRFRLTPKQRTR
jgi:hypothetical protein